MSVLSLSEDLKNGRALTGALITTASPFIAEIYSAAGLDWIFVDAEHGSLGHAEVLALIQSAGIPCLVRCPGHDEGWIKKSLDAGAAGVIIPQVKTAEEARKLVGFSKFAPLGLRGVGAGRAYGYGQNSSVYLKEANVKTSLVLQIEHLDGVKNMREIISVEGVDAIFVGPYDLSASMGIPGEINNIGVVSKISEVLSVAKENRMPVGIYAGTPEVALKYREMGFSFIALGADIKFLKSGLEFMLDNFK